MKANILAKYRDDEVLARLGTLVRQVRSEVDALHADRLRALQVDVRRTTNPYGKRRAEYRRRYDAKKRMPDVDQCPVSNSQSRSARAARWKDLTARVRAQALPGEMWLKDWLAAKCRELGLDRSTVQNRLRQNFYPGVTVRRVNARVVFVTDANPKSGVVR